MFHKNNTRYLLAVSLFAFLIFWYQFGLDILKPSYYMWLLGGDPAQHWLGWSMFRSTPLLQWPVGENYNFGAELDNSIVYTDSIPLLAIPLKYLLWWYHGDVQYTGWWILLCCILSSLSGYAIISRLTENKTYAVIVSVFFAMAPEFTARALGHYALSAHWVVLCAIYLMMDKQLRLGRWLALVLIAVAVHAYLFAMVFPAFALKCFIERNSNGKLKTAVGFAISTLLVLFVMYAIGYFTVSYGVYKTGYTKYNADLFSMISVLSPKDSILFNVLPKLHATDRTEGFNFIGTAPLLALILSIITIAFSKEKLSSLTLTLSRIGKPALAIFTMMAIYALSTRLVILNHEVFNHNPPHFMNGITSAFRCSGRFTWPLMYLVIIITFCFIEKSFKKHAIALALVLVAIGLYDASDKYLSINNRYESQVNSVFVPDAKWNVIQKGDKIVSTDPDVDGMEWMDAAFVSYRRGAYMGFGYFARMDRVKMEKMKREAINDINTNHPKDGYIYAVHKNNVTTEAWERIKSSGNYDITGDMIVYKSNK